MERSSVESAVRGLARCLPRGVRPLGPQHASAHGVGSVGVAGDRGGLRGRASDSGITSVSAVATAADRLPLPPPHARLPQRGRCATGRGWRCAPPPAECGRGTAAKTPESGVADRRAVAPLQDARDAGPAGPGAGRRGVGGRVRDAKHWPPRDRRAVSLPAHVLPCVVWHHCASAGACHGRPAVRWGRLRDAARLLCGAGKSGTRRSGQMQFCAEGAPNPPRYHVLCARSQQSGL